MVRLFRRRSTDGDERAAPAEEQAEAEEQGEAAAATDRATERTRRSWFGRLGGLLQRTDLTADTWDSLEEILIGADTGVDTTMSVLERVRAAGPASTEELRALLRAELIEILRAPDSAKRSPEEAGDRGRLWGPALASDGAPIGDAGELEPPAVVLIVGVNGTGKTTALARLAHRYQQAGEQVAAAAGDTFRAAAIDQLQQWSARLGFDLIAHQQGADPAAVVFDAIEAARARGASVLLIDTAGRLQTRQNLMDELAKIRRVIERHLGRGPDEVALVLDATTGQNGLAQARAFTDSVAVTSVILTKLDGTAKGGIVFAVANELGLPVRFIGTGEGPDDLAPFDPERFVDALLAAPEADGG